MGHKIELHRSKVAHDPSSKSHYSCAALMTEHHWKQYCFHYQAIQCDPSQNWNFISVNQALDCFMLLRLSIPHLVYYQQPLIDESFPAWLFNRSRSNDWLLLKREGHTQIEIQIILAEPGEFQSLCTHLKSFLWFCLLLMHFHKNLKQLPRDTFTCFVLVSRVP